MVRKTKSRKKAKTFLSGFKDFITRGNVLDLAIGVVIGAAFGRIVTSLVNDIIMPPISLLLGNKELAQAKWVIQPEVLSSEGVVEAAEIALRYGAFIMFILEFLIIGFAIYAVITLIIRRKAFLEKVAADDKPKEEIIKEVVIPEDIKLLTEIRDLLKEKTE